MSRTLEAIIIRADANLVRAQEYYAQKQLDLAFTEFAFTSGRISTGLDLIASGMEAPYGDQEDRLEAMQAFVQERLTTIKAILENGEKPSLDGPSNRKGHRIATPRSVQHLLDLIEG